MRVFHCRNLAVLVGVCGVIVASLPVASGQTIKPLPQPPPGVSVERGNYFVTVQDCNGCHTPFKNGEPDMTRMLSGHPETINVNPRPQLPAPFETAITGTNTAWAGPWGLSITTNLTPDRATGTGSWTEQMFINAIRTGRKGGSGRPLLPPMPYFNLASLSDDDIKAVFAYLRSLPPVHNRVPQPVDPPEAQ